jgi:cell wall-associated NlpC family hydrolase
VLMGFGMHERVGPATKRHGDEGAATAILVVGMALVMVAAMLMFTRIAQANDLRTKAQTGADAAALGALAPLRDQAVDLALQGMSPEGIAAWLLNGGPDPSARRYAQKNNTDLVGEVHLSGLLGRTAKVDVSTRDCQLKKDDELTPQEREDLKRRRNLCTESTGKQGIGRHGRATAIARLVMPECTYHYMDGEGPADGGGSPIPSWLSCGDGDVKVYPGGVRSVVTKLFKIRLVDKEDPVAYTGMPSFANLTYTGPLPPLPENASDIVKKIIAYAYAQIGKPYIWGGTGPTGYDCSGLMMMAYRSAGVSIPRVTFTQWPFGVHVPGGTEQPGDLVFFSGSDGSPSNPGHVGLVVDPAKHLMVEAWCTSCGPIHATQYSNRNPVGFTRPLARFGKQ